MSPDAQDFRLVDLFCGAGGFSRGAHAAGYRVAAAFDLDPVLCSSYARNFPTTNLKIADVSELKGSDLVSAAGGAIEGIFGGPPCQGFSEIGLNDPSDPRRALLGHFFRLIAEASPRFFAMENVRGLASKTNRAALDAAMAPVMDCYDILGPQVWEAHEFGAATKRPRVFVLGIRKDLSAPLRIENFEAERAGAATVRDAIIDLKGAAYDLDDEDGFDVWKSGADAPEGYAGTLRAPDGRFTGNRATVHTPEVRNRFSTVPPGAIDRVGRHARLAWDGLCPTLRAGTGADRGSFQSVRPLHPEEDRVITVREAARLQGFPDEHTFHPTVWHSFRMIGNSVSPIVSAAIFRTIARHLEAVDAVQ